MPGPKALTMSLIEVPDPIAAAKAVAPISRWMISREGT